MEQVIMNLAVNARDAMPAGGTLVLETTNLAVHGGPVPDGAYVALRVRDTGTGLSPEARAHLFEPFFTTKAKGKGTGLGLATVYGIVKQNQGEIHVESDPGRGTAFEILLPRSPEAPTLAPRPVPVGPVGGSETVLLVEDEPRLRDLLARSLRGAGYRVIAAASGGEALALGAEAIEQTCLLVTDLVMPGMDGRSTADALRRRHPSLPVLFVSGYAEEDGRPGELNAMTGFLSKPFTPGDLLTRIRGLLDGVAERLRPPVPGASSAAWRPELATGIREVDMQHRELLVQIAALERASLAGDLLQADDALAYLERYAAEHFATEELLMRDLGYPQLEAHRSLHVAFRSQLGLRKAAYREDRSQATLLLDLARWMEGWLGDHVLGADAEMARFVRSPGRLPVPGRAGVDVDEVLRAVEPDAT
jgi:hemerythrin-like metal-binding protein